MHRQIHLLTLLGLLLECTRLLLSSGKCNEQIHGFVSSPSSLPAMEYMSVWNKKQTSLVRFPTPTFCLAVIGVSQLAAGIQFSLWILFYFSSYLYVTIFITVLMYPDDSLMISRRGCVLPASEMGKRCVLKHFTLISNLFLPAVKCSPGMGAVGLSRLALIPV